MNKILLSIFVVFSALLTGCSIKAPVEENQPYTPKNTTAKINDGLLAPKVDTLFILNDSSSSMSALYEGAGFHSGATKLSVAKTLLSRMNQAIPETKLNTGLRSFGFGPCIDWDGYSTLNQSIQPHASEALQNTIQSLKCSSGGTPIANAMQETQNDLKTSSGNIALFIISDGHNYEKSPAPIVDQLKQQLGNRLCVYTLWVGNEKETAGQAVLQELSEIGQCGGSTTVDQVASNDGMSQFIEQMMFNKIAPPIIQPVKEEVIEIDSDGDNIADSRDNCPDTPKGANVDSKGCWSFSDTYFATDSVEITDKNSPIFKNAIEVLHQNPNLSIEIQGHTDDTGSQAYNQKLSERRAEAVKTELIRQGVNASRLTTIGLGETEPVAPNNTVEGRQLNRRVVYKKIN